MMQQRVGFHGKLTGACVTCHADHRGRDVDLRPPLNQFAFNHDSARFVLKGQHKALACEQCHVDHAGPDAKGQKRFIGLRFGLCTDCHANPHDSPTVNDCTRCHTERGWTGRDLLFRHDRDARFKLDQLHAKVDCTACHAKSDSPAGGASGSSDALRFTPLALSCEECHKSIADGMAGRIAAATLPTPLPTPLSAPLPAPLPAPLQPDPHNGRVKCIDCHATSTPLYTPAQFADACAKCHTDRYRNLYFDWRRSLDERVAAASVRLKSEDPAHESDLSRRLNEAQQIGIHNIAATKLLLDDARDPTKEKKP
jgi:hypothetical protein